MPRAYNRTATRRYEAMIGDRIRAGSTFRAIAVALGELGVTLDVVRYTARRLGIRRPPGRPRASAPGVIPSRAPRPTRW